MARTTEEIFGNESFRASSVPKPDMSGSSKDEPAEVEPKAADKGATPETDKFKAKPAAPIVAQPKAEAHDEDDADEPIPQGLDKLEGALKKARGDGRRYKKQWRDIEREAATLRGELQALRSYAQQPRQPVEPKQEPQKKSFWEGEPEAFIREELAAAGLTQAQQRIMSEERVLRLAVPDAGEALDAFKDAAKADPSLRMAFNANGGSVEFAYQQGKALLGQQQERSLYEKYGVSSAVELEAKILEQAAGGVPNISQQRATRPVLPPKSNASARGAGGGGFHAWSGPRSTDQVWGK